MKATFKPGDAVAMRTDDYQWYTVVAVNGSSSVSLAYGSSGRYAGVYGTYNLRKIRRPIAR